MGRRNQWGGPAEAGDSGAATLGIAGSGFVALAAALTWAASPIFWGQAVVTEVYTFNALIVVALLWLLWRWREAIDADAHSQPLSHTNPTTALLRGTGAEPVEARRSDQRMSAFRSRSTQGSLDLKGGYNTKWPAGWPWLTAAGLALGLGLGNHLTLLLMLPGAAIWIWAGRRAAGRGAAGRGAAGRPLARELLAALAAVVVGLTVYAYLPLVAAANPPVSWMDPRRPAQLWALISGQVYRGLIFDLPLAYLPARLVAWNGEALRQFGGIWGAILALIGLWRLDRQLHAWWQATLLIAADVQRLHDRL